MTAMLDKIRQLEAAERRGDISALDARAMKARLLASVDEAAPEVVEMVGAEAKAPETNPPVVWHVVFFCFAAMGACTALGAFLFGDLMLALTLSITCLAAFTVKAFRALED